MSNAIHSKVGALSHLKISTIAIAALLAAITWIAYFSNLSQFGLYYEDYTRIPDAMQWSWSDLGQYLLNVPKWMIEMEYEGRPLHPALIYLFTVIGEHFGGISTLYFIGYGINVINTWLFYSLMLRSSHQPFLALTSTLGFVLFPVNTNHAFLTSALGVLPALTLLLIALHLYFAIGKKYLILSYLSIFISLFCYEKFFPLFWVAPLLKPQWRWNAKSRRELLRHTAILIGMVLVIAIVRKLNGEGRVDNLGGAAIAEALSSLLIGPVITITTFIRRPIQMIGALQGEWLIPLSLSLLAIAYCLYQFKLLNRNGQAFFVRLNGLERSAANSESAYFWKTFVRYGVAGCLMLVLAYPFTFTGSVYDLEGRESHVHVAAIVGASILCGCVCSAIEFVAHCYQKRFWTSLGLATFFTLLIGVGFTVQEDYATGGLYQRAFWTDVVKLCPDMTRNTVILVEFEPLTKIHRMNPFLGRHFARILGYIYKFPDEWINDTNFNEAEQPKIYRLETGWQTKILSDQNKLKINRQTAIGRRDLPGNVDSSDVILLDAEDGRLVRQTSQLVLAGQTLPLKQNDPPVELPPFEPNVLYDDFIIADHEASVEYLTAIATH